jgi:hypothetical protein
MARVGFIALLFLAIVGFVAGCGQEKAPVDRTGTNAVAKSFFVGSSWYFGRTVIDVDYEGGQLGTFPGDAALDFQGSDLAAMPRIRWVIEENKLLAFRDYELIEGANPGMPQPGSFLGQPVAAVPGSTFRTFNPTVVRPVCTGPTDWARATSSWTRMFRTAATRQKMPTTWSSSRTAFELLTLR